MDLYLLLGVLYSIGAALFALFLISKLIRREYKPSRFTTIDGLRGYLAFFVFLHHAFIYSHYVKTLNWVTPSVVLFDHFGSVSVSLFFMITSFLFTTKLLESKRKPIDWLNLMVGRILRLYPLFLIALFISFLFAAIFSHFKMVEPVSVVLSECFAWFMFTVIDRPNINAVQETGSFTAGVLWSLKYEWFFYLILPVFGFFTWRSRPPLIILLICLYIAYLIVYGGSFEWNIAAIFIGGIVAAFLARNKKFCSLASSKIASLLIVSCFVIIAVFFDSGYDAIPVILASIAFIGIACGNSLFGIFTSKLSSNFGQLSYGIYLLQGLLFFFVFNFVLGISTVASFTQVQYWLLIGAMGALLVVITFCTYHFVEYPAIKATGKTTAFLRRFIPKFLVQPKIEAVDPTLN
jgi:peptidoglycan/LPS O-acetylase OafA/YrhL